MSDIVAAPEKIVADTTGFRVDKAIQILAQICKWSIVVALIVLGLRSAIRLENRWDTFLYHLPFAAKRGGIPLPYEMSDEFSPWYEGFPPLADFVQGILWRLTGTANATGVAGFLAFAGFLAYCQRVLKANFWLVAMIALTAPMVVIHAACSYIDLFGNAFLAIGLCSCLFLYLFPERSTRSVVVGGLIGLAGAAWTKFLLMPAVGFGFILCAIVLLRRNRPSWLTRKQAVVFLLVGGAVAAVPYLKNWILYANPFWPVRIPVIGGYFPYFIDGEVLGAGRNRPPHLADASKATLFFRSLFEIEYPSFFPDRTRWTIDQGNTRVAFRMGGFWGTGVIFYLATAIAMLVAFARKKGVFVVASFAALLGVVANIPQSHELRYYLFIPLCWGGAVAIFYPELRKRAPKVALGLLGGAFCLFLYMVSENRAHYAITPRNFELAAYEFGAVNWWPKLQRGEVYCAVGMTPAAITLIGPTLSEFRIVERTNTVYCPKDSVIITHAGFLGARGLGLEALNTPAWFVNQSVTLFQHQDYHGAIAFAKRAIEGDPGFAEAYNNLCIGYGNVSKWEKAAVACEKAIELRPDFQLARNNLEWIKRSMAVRGQN